MVRERANHEQAELRAALAVASEQAAQLQLELTEARERAPQKAPIYDIASRRRTEELTGLLQSTSPLAEQNSDLKHKDAIIAQLQRDLTDQQASIEQQDELLKSLGESERRWAEFAEQLQKERDELAEQLNAIPVMSTPAPTEVGEAAREAEQLQYLLAEIERLNKMLKQKESRTGDPIYDVASPRKTGDVYWKGDDVNQDADHEQGFSYNGLYGDHPEVGSVSQTTPFYRLLRDT